MPDAKMQLVLQGGGAVVRVPLADLPQAVVRLHDYCPANRIMHGISTAILAVQTRATDALSVFPANPAAENPKAPA